MWRPLLALVAGAALPLAFAPFGLAPLAILAPLPLIAVWRYARPGRAAWHGFLFGFGMFVVGVSWVYHSMHDFGGMAPPLAGLAVVLFAAYLALFPAIAGALQARLRGLGDGPRLVLLVPALWGAAEWLRGWLFSGFSWLALGYSQTGWPLAGLAPWVGVYGVGTAVMASAGLLLCWWRQPRRWVWPLALLVLWGAAQLAGMPRWTSAVAEPVPVALVQGNVPLLEKWDPAQRDRILARYLELSRGARDARLVVWPEAAVPGFLDQLPAGYRDALESEFRSPGRGLLFGVLDRDASGAAAVYNAVATVGGGGAVYHKRHLVPFGEFVPLPALTRWLMGSLEIPMSDMTPGAGPPEPLTLAGHRIGVSICYEDAYARDVLPLLPDAEILVNVSEDAWFGDSLGPHQRLQMARIRARETGRYMLRAANTGVSAVIDERGEIIARTPQFEQRVLHATVQPLAGSTPFVRFGNWWAGLWLLMLVAAWRLRLR